MDREVYAQSGKRKKGDSATPAPRSNAPSSSSAASNQWIDAVVQSHENGAPPPADPVDDVIAAIGQFLRVPNTDLQSAIEQAYRALGRDINLIKTEDGQKLKDWVYAQDPQPLLVYRSDKLNETLRHNGMGRLHHTGRPQSTVMNELRASSGFTATNNVVMTPLKQTVIVQRRSGGDLFSTGYTRVVAPSQEEKIKHDKDAVIFNELGRLSRHRDPHIRKDISTSLKSGIRKPGPEILSLELPKLGFPMDPSVVDRENVPFGGFPQRVSDALMHEFEVNITNNDTPAPDRNDFKPPRWLTPDELQRFYHAKSLSDIPGVELLSMFGHGYMCFTIGGVAYTARYVRNQFWYISVNKTMRWWIADYRLPTDGLPLEIFFPSSVELPMYLHHANHAVLDFQKLAKKAFKKDTGSVEYTDLLAAVTDVQLNLEFLADNVADSVGNYYFGVIEERRLFGIAIIYRMLVLSVYDKGTTVHSPWNSLMREFALSQGAEAIQAFERVANNLIVGMMNDTRKERAITVASE